MSFKVATKTPTVLSAARRRTLFGWTDVLPLALVCIASAGVGPSCTATLQGLSSSNGGNGGGGPAGNGSGVAGGGGAKARPGVGGDGSPSSTGGGGGPSSSSGGVSGGLGGGAGPGGAGGDAPPGSGGTFTGTGTTVQGIFIPGAHPRLFWTPARIAAAKKWWTSNSFTPRNDVYSVADQLFAYIASGNQTYCTQAIGFSMAVNLSDCVPTKAGCDEARWDGETAILTYDWCYSVMTAAQRTTFQTNWNTWLNNVRAQDWGGVGMSQSNYYWGTVRDEIEWAIASYQENQTAADAFLTDAITTRYMNDFVPATQAAGQAMGGLGLEGGQYGPYQSYYMSAIVLPTLASSGRDMWTEATPYWKGAVLNRIYMTPAQPTVTVNKQRAGWEVFPFGDDETWQDGAPATATEKGTFMTAAADRWSGSNIGRWAQRWLMNVSPNVDKALASSVTAGSAQDFAFLPLDYYDAGPRYLMGRNNWTTTATTWLWQMGDHYSDGHNHDDWGGFQINRKGRWLTRETAGYTESVAGFGGTGSVPLYTALGHNVPIINGNGGVPTRGFPPAKGQEGSWTSSPVVHRLESKPGYSYGDVDLTGAYHCCVGGTQSGDNGAAVHVEREYWFVRDIETTVVLDRLQSDTATRSKTFVVHCETNPVLVDATHVNCVNGDQQLAVTTLLPATPSSRIVINESTGASPPPPPQNTQYRVEINDAPNSTTSYTLHVMQAMDATGTRLAPTVVDSAPGQATTGTLTVTIDANHRITINKGMTSTGGSIAINGTTTNLRADIQGMALDATDMPVWGP
jgi:hypothetical protein